MGSGTGRKDTNGKPNSTITRRQPGRDSVTRPPSTADQKSASLCGSRQSIVPPAYRPGVSMAPNLATVEFPHVHAHRLEVRTHRVVERPPRDRQAERRLTV